MLIKLILVVLIIAMLASLATALNALFRDQEEQNSQRTLKWLIIRVSLAVAIILVAAYGFFTGQLTIGAPWTGQY